MLSEVTTKQIDEPIKQVFKMSLKRRYFQTEKINNRRLEIPEGRVGSCLERQMLLLVKIAV